MLHNNNIKEILMIIGLAITKKTSRFV